MNITTEEARLIERVQKNHRRIPDADTAVAVVFD